MAIDQTKTIEVVISNNLSIDASITSNLNIDANIVESANINAELQSGKPGRSAYQAWLDNGHIGTELDFLYWLRHNTFIHDVMVPSKTWDITHNLGKYPSVSVVNSANVWVIGDIQYINENRLIITFSSEFSGKAYLN